MNDKVVNSIIIEFISRPGKVNKYLWFVHDPDKLNQWWYMKQDLKFHNDLKWQQLAVDYIAKMVTLDNEHILRARVNNVINADDSDKLKQILDFIEWHKGI